MAEIYSAEWFESVLNAMSEFVLVKGDRSKLLWANTAFCDYYGMSSAQLKGLIDAPHSDPDDTLQYVRDDHEVFTTGKRLEVVEPITDGEGGTAYFATIKTALSDDSGSIIGTVGTCRPVPAEKAESSSVVRQARKQKLSDLRALVQHIPMAVALLDVKQRVVAVSQAWQRLFASTEGKVGDDYEKTYGKLFDLQSVFHRSINDRETATIDDFACDVPEQGELRFQVHAEPFMLPTGQVGGVTVLLHDVTNLRQHEAALARANDELTQFNYRVSHDIKAPLRSILGLASICREQVVEGADPVLDRALEHLEQSAERLAGLVQNLMILARADVDERDEEACEVATLIDEALRRHDRDLKSKGIQISLDLTAPTLWTQRVRLAQCIENLVSNAVKYADGTEGEPAIAIAAAQVGSKIEVKVSDNGVGMDPEVVPKVFDQFFRGSAQQPGDGLGLYIVKKHAERLGGSVAVTNASKPTEFTLTVPARSTP